MSKGFNREEQTKYKEYAPFMNSSYNMYVHIHMTQKALLNARYSEVKAFGITIMELALLTIVKGHGGEATPAQIARLIMRRRSTVSGLLNRMERNGLIRRSEYKNNKRLRKVTLTDKGKKVLEQTWEVDNIHDIVGSLSDEEFKQLWTLLEKLQNLALKHTK
ncbi:MAG: MarR family transcriptional regulator [Dehalococcoidia bacterium]|jgi:DNA-binding MarR family transcriptional regulator